MLLALSLALSAAAAPLPGGPARCDLSTVAQRVTADSTLLALFERGQPYAQFLADVKNRREGWHRINDSARVDSALIARARAVGGSWKILVVAVDGCGDSMNSVPYVARLADSVPGLEVRIVAPSDGGQAVQESHRTLDGRAATPTFVLLDERGVDSGCIVELPREVRHWAHDLRTRGKADSLYPGKNEFYERNRGVGITTELVELLEGARAGTPVCDKGAATLPQ